MSATIPESKGACQRCGEHIAFPKDMEGENVPCPHCRMETTLVASFNPSLVRKFEPDVQPPKTIIVHGETVTLRPSGMRTATIVMAYPMCAIIPIVGLCWGIYLLGKKEPGHGAASIGISIFMFLFWLNYLTTQPN